MYSAHRETRPRGEQEAKNDQEAELIRDDELQGGPLHGYDDRNSLERRGNAKAGTCEPIYASPVTVGCATQGCVV